VKRVTLTGSGLWRAARCIASAVLPRARETSEWAERGSGIHAFLLDVNRRGRDEALAALSNDELRAACALINTARLPVDPSAYAAEVAFAYDVATGRATELHRGGQRDYSMCTPTEIPMTVDVVALVGDTTVGVYDYKSGWKYLEPPAANWQFRACGLAAARAYKRDHVFAQMIRLGKDGEPYVTGGELNLYDLAEIAEELRALHADATRAAAADADPPIQIGSHCQGCESMPFCGSTQMIRRRYSEELQSVQVAEALTPELASDAWEWLEGLEAHVEAAWKILQTYARFNPFRLRDGRVYGIVEEDRDTIDGQRAWQVLADRFGQAKAWQVTKLVISKTGEKGIETLAAELAEAEGRKRAPVMRELLEDLRRAGALTTHTIEKFKAHKERR